MVLCRWVSQRCTYVGTSQPAFLVTFALWENPVSWHDSAVASSWWVGTDHAAPQHIFPLRPPSFYSSFFQPPLVMFGYRGGQCGREGETRWKHGIDTSVEQLSVAQHLFPFWCLLSTLCQRIWSPQMWTGLFSSGNLAHPTYFFSLTLILLGKLSLVIKPCF